MKIKKFFKVLITLTIIIFGIYTIIDVFRYGFNPENSAPWYLTLIIDGAYLVIVLLLEVLIYKIITQKTHIIAYGSNISSELLKEHCKDVTYVCKGILKDYELCFKTVDNVRSFATVEKDKDAELPIVIYKISKQDSVKLDQYEEVEHGLYYKKRKIVFMNKRIYWPVMYIMNKESKPMRPSQDYLDKLYKGYNEYNLDINYIEKALQKNK